MNVYWDIFGVKEQARVNHKSFSLVELFFVQSTEVSRFSRVPLLSRKKLSGTASWWEWLRRKTFCNLSTKISLKVPLTFLTCHFLTKNYLYSTLNCNLRKKLLVQIRSFPGIFIKKIEKKHSFMLLQVCHVVQKIKIFESIYVWKIFIPLFVKLNFV